MKSNGRSGFNSFSILFGWIPSPAFLVAMAMLVFTMSVKADDKINMNFKDEELTKVIETYSKATKQKFIVDPGVRGKISIFLPEPVGFEEAYEHLSAALAVNGYGISRRGDTLVVVSARNIQRDLIEVSTERPSLKPQRMYTWIYKLKNTSASQINKEIRILLSKDGELSVNASTNQLIFTDWVSNLNRVADILRELDKPQDPHLAKTIESEKVLGKKKSKFSSESGKNE